MAKESLRRVIGSGGLGGRYYTEEKFKRASRALDVEFGNLNSDTELDYETNEKKPWQDFVDDPTRFSIIGDIVAVSVARHLKSSGYVLDTVIRDLTQFEEYSTQSPFKDEGYGIVVVCAPAIINYFDKSDRTTQVPLMLENANMQDTPTVLLPFTVLNDDMRERYDFIVDGITKDAFMPEIAMPSLFNAMEQCVERRKAQLGTPPLY